MSIFESINKTVLRHLPKTALTDIVSDARLVERAALVELSRKHALFPVKGLISIRMGKSIEEIKTWRDERIYSHDQTNYGPEVGSIGPEGGICQTVGDEFYIIAQTDCIFVAVPTPLFKKLTMRHPSIAELARQCDDWLVLQARYLAGCNSRHGAERRLARVLSRTAEAYCSDVGLPLNQTTIATALGIRRTTVTLIAQGLQEEGLISYRRGKIQIQNSDALRMAACECHKILGPSRWPSLSPEKEVA